MDIMKTLYRTLIISLPLCVLTPAAEASTPVEVPSAQITKSTQWEGKKVGILGDSMSDPRLGVTTKRFYNYLSDLIGIDPYPYATNGFQWKDLVANATRMKAEHPDDLDAIFIWVGTNDFNSSRPIGDFFTETVEEVNVNGRMEKRKKRTHILDESTLAGSINLLLSYLKTNFPTQQIVILTPIHRAFATFGSSNVQPSEEYANGAGLYLDDYIHAIRKSGDVWAVPVIDLYSLSGLFPLEQSHDRYIADPDSDRLHPNDEGHYRLARTLQYQLMSLPPSFQKPE